MPMSEQAWESLNDALTAAREEIPGTDPDQLDDLRTAVSDFLDAVDAEDRSHGRTPW